MAEITTQAQKAFNENFSRVREQIAQAAQSAGRSPQEVTLLAATKTVPAEMINYAVSQGLACLGENRVQELLEKYDALDRAHCDLQFIGRLQTNKVKYLTGKVSCIQSVDSVKLAREISRQHAQAGLCAAVLVQVNIGREPQKGGVLPEALFEFIDEIRTFPGIRVEGLMAVPPVCDNNTVLSRYFLDMHKYYVDIAAKKSDNVNMHSLSMGMSSDFPLAIQCGATMVRVGSSLFGARQYAGMK